MTAPNKNEGLIAWLREAVEIDIRWPQELKDVVISSHLKGQEAARAIQDLEEEVGRLKRADRAVWQGDSSILPVGASVEVLAVDHAGAELTGEVPARTACWVRWRPDGSDFYRYRSCDLGDLECLASTADG